MIKLMKESDAPIEQYERIGLDYNKEVTEEDIIEYKNNFEKNYLIDKDFENIVSWEGNTKNELTAFINLVKIADKESLVQELKDLVKERNLTVITSEVVEEFVKARVDEERRPMIMYFLNLLSRRK